MASDRVSINSEAHQKPPDITVKSRPESKLQIKIKSFSNAAFPSSRDRQKRVTPRRRRAVAGRSVVIQQPDDSGGKPGGVGFESDVDFILRVQAFGGQRGGDDAARRRPQAFQTLDAGSAAGAQGSHDDSRLGDLPGPGVFDGAGDLDAGGFR